MRNLTDQNLAKNISCEFTYDASLIKKFITLRQKLYKEDKRFIGYRLNIKENYLNKNHSMLLLNEGSECIGGAGFTIHEPGSDTLLPLEQCIIEELEKKEDKARYCLQNLLSQYELKDKRYAEFNRIVISPRFRNGELTKIIFNKILEKAVELKVDYLFGLADALRSRYYKGLYKRLGLSVNIHYDTKLPTLNNFEEIPMYINSLDLRSFKEEAQACEKNSISF